MPSLYLALKVLGGLYLCYLGLRIIRAARQPINVAMETVPVGRSLRQSFLVGLGTQVSNPKTAIVYASVFAAFLPSGPSPLLGVMVLLAIFAIEAGWYSLVAVVLSASRLRRAYLSYKAWIDRAAGAAMGALGLGLLYSARDSAP